MTPTLLPCPFCGGEATCYHHDEEENGWVHQDWVSCKDEDCGAQTCLHATSHEAIAAWNRRDRPASGEREGEVDTDRFARDLYQQATDNDPNVHCNRFPAWSELSKAQKDVWREKAAALSATAPSPAPAGASEKAESNVVPMHAEPPMYKIIDGRRVDLIGEWEPGFTLADNPSPAPADELFAENAKNEPVQKMHELAERLGKSAKEALSADHLSFDVLWTRCDLWAGDMSNAALRLTEQAAEIERLKEDAEKCCDGYEGHCATLTQVIKDKDDALATAEARVKELEAALKPFAKAAGELNWDEDCLIEVSLRDLRRACAVLRKEG